MFLVELFVCYLSDIHFFTQAGPASSCHIPWLLKGPFLAFASLKLHLFYMQSKIFLLFPNYSCSNAPKGFSRSCCLMTPLRHRISQKPSSQSRLFSDASSSTCFTHKPPRHIGTNRFPKQSAVPQADGWNYPQNSLKSSAKLTETAREACRNRSRSMSKSPAKLTEIFREAC